MTQSVLVCGKKKTAVATAKCTKGKGVVTVNQVPVTDVEPEVLRMKVLEPLVLLGSKRMDGIDISVKVRGGGQVSQIYAARQAISKSVVAYYQKYVDESSKKEIYDILISHDRSLLVADPRRREAKKFGGPGARARYQKSYR